MKNLNSYTASGWVSSNSNPCWIEVRLQTGELVHAVRQPSVRQSLTFGTPVSVEIFDRSGYAWAGRILDASPLPAIPIKADRPLGIIDTSNIASAADTNGQPIGMPAVWAAAWILDSAGYAVRLVDDPMSDRFWHKDPISSATLLRLKSTPFSRRWPRIVKHWGSHRHNAEKTALSFLRETAGSIFITRDGLDDLHVEFPELDDFTFLGRICAPLIENGRISICGLDDFPPSIIPTSLFMR